MYAAIGLACVLWAGLAAAEPAAGHLTGVVTDLATGAPVEGANVHVSDGAGHARVVVTDRAGRYAIDVAPGSYDIAFGDGDARTTDHVAVASDHPASLDGLINSLAGEVIVIQEHRPPAVPAQPRNVSERRAPPYSDAAILQDAWTRAWMLLDVSPAGEVTRFKFLKQPGYDLETIAAAEVWKLRFSPARDDRDRAIATWFVWKIEWPSPGWLLAHGLPLTTMPLMTGVPPRSTADKVPCLGSGPLNLSSVYPVYRDCSTPDLSLAPYLPWITRP